MEKQESNKTVVEVAKAYSEVSNEAAKKQILENCGIKTYLPIEEKIRSITNIVYNKLGQTNEEGLVYYSGIDSMIYLILSITAEYTNLVMGEDLEDFDALMSSGLMSAILEKIGDDYEIYQQLYELVMKEFLSENNTISKYVELCVNAIMRPIMEFSDTITNFVDSNGGIDNLLGQLQSLQNQLSE